MLPNTDHVIETILGKNSIDENDDSYGNHNSTKGFKGGGLISCAKPGELHIYIQRYICIHMDKDIYMCLCLYWYVPLYIYTFIFICMYTTTCIHVLIPLYW
jgi:hypothetical protein